MENGQITSISEPGVKAEGQLLSSMRREVANILNRSQLGFPGAQPVSFARQHLEELTQQEYVSPSSPFAPRVETLCPLLSLGRCAKLCFYSYYVCEKSDGIRYLLYSTADEAGQEAHYLIDRKNDYWFINNRNLHFPIDGDPQQFHLQTVTDGELVWDTLANGVKEPRFLIFDCLVMDGKILMDRTLDKRLAYVQERLYTPYKKLFKEYPEERQYQPFFLEMKPFQLGYGIEMMFKQILPNLTHGNDGLIFTCRNTPYKHGTDPHILKWKPPEENTIDFQLKLNFPTVEPDEAERAEGITEPFVDYDSVPHAELMYYVGPSDEDHKKFSDAYITEEEWETLKGLGDPLNDRIVECNLDDQERWRILRFRDDKLKANHQSTVFSVQQSIKDRVSETDLYKAAGPIRESWKARQARQK